MKKIFYFFIFSYCIIFHAYGFQQYTAPPNFKNKNITSYYDALSGNDTVKINISLQSLKPISSDNDKAFTGALMMKKSDLIKTVKRKMDLFKEGRVLLEEAIVKENNNAEFRFLRLIIQEHCPEVVKYHESINKDAEIVKKAYPQFTPELQKVILDYSKNSTALKSLIAN